MKTKLLFVLTLGWLIVSVAASDTTDTITCEQPSAPTACQGDAQAPVVTIHTKRWFSKKLKFTPRCINAKLGSSIEFRMLPGKNNSVGSAEISPKDPNDTWLAGKNDIDKDVIIIKVPGDISEGPHDYAFKTSNKCIDPRVNVQN